MQSSTEIQQTEEFEQHNPDLVKLNIERVDLSWVSQYRSGEEIENEDIPFILEKLNWGVNRLANGRINNSTLDRVRKMGGGWHITPFHGLADRHKLITFDSSPTIHPQIQKNQGSLKSTYSLPSVELDIKQRNTDESNRAAKWQKV